MIELLVIAFYVAAVVLLIIRFIRVCTRGARDD